MTHDLGQIVNALGCSAASLNEDAMISDVVVLCKTVQPDGTVTMLTSFSDGMSWIERLGMLHAAIGIETQAGYHDA